MLDFVIASSDKSIFTFSTFISSLAIIIVVYSIIDIRYRFRIATSFISLYRLTFASIIIIGVVLLLIDIWYANNYTIIYFLDHKILFQGICAFLFFIIILLWIYFAFISPSKFGKWNYKRYMTQLYRIILKGSERDMSIIADELCRSIKNIVKYSITKQENKKITKLNEYTVNYCAYEIFLLIGNRKFCKSIMGSSPNFAILLFQEISRYKKYDLPVNQFAQNITQEALMNTNSILYHEDDGFYSGLIGYIKPFSNSIYGDSVLVESLSSSFSQLDIDYEFCCSWNAKQLKAYTKCVLIFLENYLDKQGWYQHSYTLIRSLANIQNSCNDLYKLENISTDYWGHNIYKKLTVVVDFISKFIALIDNLEVKNRPICKFNKKDDIVNRDLYDEIAVFIFKIITNASGITTKEDVNWSIQYSLIWSKFFTIHDSDTYKIVRKKLIRLLYNEVKQLEKLPNYRSAKVLGFCLNVLGINTSKCNHMNFYSNVLKKFVIKWTKHNFISLREKYIDIADSCLVGTISFDETNRKIVKTYIKGLNTKPPRDFLELI